MSADGQETLLDTLKDRFGKNMARHPGVDWASIKAKLETNPRCLESLQTMESTGGEPDVVDLGDGLAFVDCAAESPKRRSLCYDRAALDARKENKPAGSAVGMAEEMGIELLTEEQYRRLQTLGEFDLKTSSWLLTPDNIRKLDGSIFGDRRYGTVFVFHNGADSYYASRGFRGALRI